MSGTASIIILFGLACTEPCALSAGQRAQIDQAVVRLLAGQGFDVRPAPPGAPRPTADEANLEPRDEAARLEVSRLLVLDLESKTRRLWLTHFVRGSQGPWSVSQHTCEPSDDPCPGLEPAVRRGLRPRTAQDVDFVAMLRRAGGPVGRCVAEEDLVPAALRLFGRVEMDLVVSGQGRVQVEAIAPARAARGPLGACLRAVMGGQNVGPFEGGPVRMRIPLDL